MLHGRGYTCSRCAAPSAGGGGASARRARRAAAVVGSGRHHRPCRSHSISASLREGTAAATSHGAHELLALDPARRELDQRGGARRARTPGPASSTRSSAANSARCSSAPSPARSTSSPRASSSPASVVGASRPRTSVIRCTPPGHAAGTRRGTPRRGGRRSTATTMRLGVAQRVRDEVEARHADDRDPQRLGQHLGRRHARPAGR